MNNTILTLGIDKHMDDVEMKVESDQKSIDAAHKLFGLLGEIAPLIGEELSGRLECDINHMDSCNIRAAYEIGLANGIAHIEEIKSFVEKRGTSNG